MSVSQGRAAGAAALLVKKVAETLLIFWAAATLVFFLLDALPGDPAAVLLAQSGASGSQVEAMRREMGLDRPVLARYVHFLGDLSRGELGRSIFTGRKVSLLLLDRFRYTLELATWAMIFALAVALALGIAAAINKGRWLDKAIQVWVAFTSSVPVYWSGLLAIWVFSAHFRLLPATGEGGIAHMILPTVTLGLAISGPLARIVRNSFLEVMGNQYVMTAWGKGMPPWRVYLRHVFPNTLPVLATVSGLQFGFLLGGTVITETVFSRPGLGRLLVDSILWKDYPVVQGAVLAITAIYLVVNSLVDISYRLMDPRMHGGAG